jgi:hypothetical protein
VKVNINDSFSVLVYIYVYLILLPKLNFPLVKDNYQLASCQRLFSFFTSRSCCSLCRCRETTSLNCCQQRAYFSSPRWHMSMEPRHNYTDSVKLKKKFWENPDPVPLYSSQIPHGLTRTRIRASAVRGRRLTAWAMTRPSLHLPSFVEIAQINKNMKSNAGLSGT